VKAGKKKASKQLSSTFIQKRKGNQQLTKLKSERWEAQCAKKSAELECQKKKEK